MEKYLWEVKKQSKEPTLNQDRKTKILIIGGGIAGISCAFELSKTKKEIMVIDQNRCGNGASLRTTGKLTTLQEDLYSKIAKGYGREKAKLYYQSQKEAIFLAKKNIDEYQIDCDFQEVDSYLFVTEEKNKEKLAKEENLFQDFAKVKKEEKLPIVFPCQESISTPHTAVFHPLKYILKLKEICKEKNVTFFEKTMATKLEKQKDGYVVYANDHKIEADIVIVSCHYPTFIIPGFIPFKTYLEKSFIGAWKTPVNKEFSAINLDKETYSMRYHTDQDNHYFLFLSETHKLSDGIQDEEKRQALEAKCQSFFHKKHTFLWSNYDLMTNDSLPFIGRIHKNDPNLYLATGFNTWGMTNGILAGKMISDLIGQKESPYQLLFRPDRPCNLTKLSNDMINNFNQIKSLIGSKLKSDTNPDYVKMITKNGKRYGIFTDSKGVEHAVSLLCPHFKCSLTFNQSKQTWDCPCHGSRFDIDGNVLKGPACYSIKADPKEL